MSGPIHSLEEVRYPSFVGKHLTLDMDLLNTRVLLLLIPFIHQVIVLPIDNSVERTVYTNKQSISKRLTLENGKAIAAPPYMLSLYSALSKHSELWMKEINEVRSYFDESESYISAYHSLALTVSELR